MRNLLLLIAALVGLSLASCERCKTCQAEIISRVNGDTTNTAEGIPVEYCGRILRDREDQPLDTAIVTVDGVTQITIKRYNCQ
jgi:hypothetical protein